MRGSRPGPPGPGPRARSEEGATAILVAVLSLVLLGVGAIAVDMGQVYAKRAALQSNVDLAALAAAAELDGTDRCSVAAKEAAARLLTTAGNEVDLQAPLDFNDGDLSNGQIVCSGWSVKLWAPSARVDFGLAKALSPDNDGVDVPAYAEAAVYSPRGRGIMPTFVAQGCDYGDRTLRPDPDAGSGSVPRLREDEPVDDTLLPVSMTPTSINPDSPGGVVIVRGTGLAPVNRVAFSTALGASNLHVEETPFLSTDTRVRVPIPLAVRSTVEEWFLRVSRDGGDTWSAARISLRLVIRDLTLHCDTGASAGDFGTLALPRRFNSTAENNLARNLARGLDFSVTTFTDPRPAWQCSGGSGGAVTSSPGSLQDLTNCALVDPDIGSGMPANAAQRGLLTGPSVGRPRLARSTTAGCGSSLVIRFGGTVGTRSINNDTLDCFLKSGATNSFQSASYSGSAVIRGSIFRSPRFFWVPVLGTSTTGGGPYQIVDFRPAFITGPTGGSNYNGFYLPWRGGRRSLEGIRIVLFSADALPESVADVPTMDYLGVGTKVLGLVD
jgi:Putative Flp pilus-assembly TadE/G-like